MLIISNCLILLFTSAVSLLVFCLLVSDIERRVSKPPTIIVDLFLFKFYQSLFYVILKFRYYVYKHLGLLCPVVKCLHCP